MGGFGLLGNLVLNPIFSLSVMIPDKNLIWFEMFDDETLFLKTDSEGFYDFGFVILIPVWDCDSVGGFVFDFWCPIMNGFLRLIL